MESLPGYDAWLEAPYTSEAESCEHECYECEGLGSLDDIQCEYCKGEGVCDGDCEPDDPPGDY